MIGVCSGQVNVSFYETTSLITKYQTAIENTIADVQVMAFSVILNPFDGHSVNDSIETTDASLSSDVVVLPGDKEQRLTERGDLRREQGLE